MNIQPMARKLGSADGAEIAEAALVLPLVFMLLLGIVWFGRAFNIYSTIQQAAQQGAITAARATCATCGNAQAADSAVTGVVEAVYESVQSRYQPDSSQHSFHPAPVRESRIPWGRARRSHDKVTVCRNVQLNPPATTQPVQCGTVVSFQYPFSSTSCHFP